MNLPGSLYILWERVGGMLAHDSMGYSKKGSTEMWSDYGGTLALFLVVHQAFYKIGTQVRGLYEMVVTHLLGTMLPKYIQYLAEALTETCQFCS